MGKRSHPGSSLAEKLPKKLMAFSTWCKKKKQRRGPPVPPSGTGHGHQMHALGAEWLRWRRILEWRSVMPKGQFWTCTQANKEICTNPIFFLVQPRVNRWTAVFYVTCQRAEKLHTSNVGRYRLPGDETQEKPREAPHEQISPANPCRK